MPLNSESLSTYSPQEFCLALKAARERKGVTLAEIANATKVPAFMYAALERNDLRRWPKGLFRRSFFRGYAGMIGVPVADWCAEFTRLFPDDEGAALAIAAGETNEADPADEVRLALDAAWHGPRASVLLRLAALLIDAGAVLMVAALAWMAGIDRPEATAIIALAYFSLGMALFGESPAKWVITERQSIVATLTQGWGAIATAWTRGADAITHVIGNADGGTHEPVDHPEMFTWITDARRVGPAPSPRFRVRIKVPQ